MTRDEAMRAAATFEFPGYRATAVQDQMLWHDIVMARSQVVAITANEPNERGLYEHHLCDADTWLRIWQQRTHGAHGGDNAR